MPRGRLRAQDPRRRAAPHLRGHAHRPAGHADLLQRQPAARREARRDRLPRVARGQPGLRRLRHGRPRARSARACSPGSSASARWSASRSGSPPTPPARRRTPAPRRPLRSRHDRSRAPHRAGARRAPTRIDRSRACPRTPGGPPTSTRRPRSAPSARSPAVRAVDVCVVLFVVSYFAFDIGDDHDTVGGLGASTVALGAALGLALLFIGIGLIQWARKLMGDHEIVEMRHPAVSSDEDRARRARRPHRRAPRSRASAAGRWSATRCSARSACSGSRPIVALRDLGPLPGRQPRATRSGRRACGSSATSLGTPIRPERPRVRRPGQRRARRDLRGRRGGRAAPRGRRPPGRQVQGRRDPGPDGARRRSPPARAARTGRSTASSATPRSAPTSAARSPSTSAPPTTCCARATSRRSTSPTRPR